MALAALPAEGIATFLMPSSTHIETAQERPRALNDAVGFSPSSFTHSCSAPMRAPSRLRPDQRRPAFSERDDRRFGRRQHGRIPPHVGGAARPHRAAASGAGSRQIVPDQQRSAATCRGWPPAAASYFVPQRLHSRWVALGIQVEV